MTVSFRAEQDDDGVVIEVEGGAAHGFGQGGSRSSQGGCPARTRGDAEPAEVRHGAERVFVADGDGCVAAGAQHRPRGAGNGAAVEPGTSGVGE
jgi:hypothetical protein